MGSPFIPDVDRNPQGTAKLREDALHAISKLAGPLGTVTEHVCQPWASITFAGSRHRATVRFEGEQGIQDGEQFMALLPEHDFAIPGQLVADSAVTSVNHKNNEFLEASIEMLLLENGS